MIDRILKTAEGEIGYLEKKSGRFLNEKTANAGTANFTKYGEWYGLNGQPWCAMFVSWCAWQAGISETIFPKHASCRAGMDWFEKRKRFFPRGKIQPMPGDVIYFQHGNSRHVGLVYKCDSTYVYTIEGNTSSASGMVANGGSVARKKYDLTYERIYGYGRPAYEEDETLTQEEFNRMAEIWLKDLGEKEPSAWSQEARNWAEQTGVIQGDEAGNKKYKKPLTREEFVQMVYRLHGDV